MRDDPTTGSTAATAATETTTTKGNATAAAETTTATSSTAAATEPTITIEKICELIRQWTVSKNFNENLNRNFGSSLTATAVVSATASPTVPIVDTVLSDVNAVMPNLISLVSSYRLLVGAAEEVSRIPGVPGDILERAIIRFDHAGTLIDVLLDLLLCKITFSSDFLAVTCAPVDLFRLLASCRFSDTPCHTAEDVVLLDILRTAAGFRGRSKGSFAPPEPISPKTPSIAQQVAKALEAAASPPAQPEERPKTGSLPPQPKASPPVPAAAEEKPPQKESEFMPVCGLSREQGIT